MKRLQEIGREIHIGCPSPDLSITQLQVAFDATIDLPILCYQVLC